MGKNAKEHRRKVAARNTKIKGIERQYQKVMNESYQAYLEQMKLELASGETQSQENFIAQ